MKLGEIRLDLMSRDFLILEKAHQENRNYVEILVVKVDVDNLKYESKSVITIGEYLNAEFMAGLYRQCAYSIDELYNNRHAQNTNTCSHQTVVVDSIITCIKCMAKLGTNLNINFSDN